MVAKGLKGEATLALLEIELKADVLPGREQDVVQSVLSGARRAALKRLNAEPMWPAATRIHADSRVN